jgi:DNA-binding HxlR family transcriptional regulator
MRHEPGPVKKALSRDQVSRAKPSGRLEPDPYDPCCPTRLLLDRIGDKWTVLVLGLLRDGPMRFNAMRRAVRGVTQKMLSQTLKSLERDGLVDRQVLPLAPVAVEYSLTPLGATLTSTIEELQRWARDHIVEVAKAQKRYDDALRAASRPRRGAWPGSPRAPSAAREQVSLPGLRNI